ncbi:hypothetical protein ACTWP4_01625 [Gracilibacillus sp. D59]
MNFVPNDQTNQKSKQQGAVSRYATQFALGFGQINIDIKETD